MTASIHKCESAHLILALMFGLHNTSIVQSRPLLRGAAMAMRPTFHGRTVVGVFCLLCVSLQRFSVHAAGKHVAFGLDKRKDSGHAMRRRRLAKFKDFSTMWREPDDVYYTDLRIGPTEGKQQLFSAIVDTGSNTIAVPCKGCSNCGGAHRHYDQSQSPTATSSGHYNQCYGEGSCNTGTIVTDKICIGKTCPVSEAAANPFGCCTRYAPNFRVQKADGIIGIAHGNTLIKSLQAQHSLEHYEFALCLGRKNGILSVGGYDESRHRSTVSWTPMTYAGSFYKVGISAVDVGGTPVALPSLLNNPFFDSGTSYTFITPNFFNPIHTAFTAFCAKKGNCAHVGPRNPSGTESIDLQTSLGCYKKLTDSQKDTFPGVTFNFPNGISFCIPPRAYFFEYPNAAISCIGINKDSSMTFGANAMVDHNVIFDIENNRLGVAVAKCDDDSSHVALASCHATSSISNTSVETLPAKKNETNTISTDNNNNEQPFKVDITKDPVWLGVLFFGLLCCLPILLRCMCSMCNHIAGTKTTKYSKLGQENRRKTLDEEGSSSDDVGLSMVEIKVRDPEEEDVHIADAIGPDTVKDEGEDPKAGGKGRIGEASNMDDLDDVQREQ